MNPIDFADFHQAALEVDAVRHNLPLSIIERLRTQGEAGGIKYWTLGHPGACALQTPGYPLLLCNLSRDECRTFADLAVGLDFADVVGTGDTALQFAERAREHGIVFDEEIPQAILSLDQEPAAPSVEGFSRLLTTQDLPLFRDWIAGFIRDAVPRDDHPSDERLLAALGEHRHWVWIAGGVPVSMAAIGRRNRTAGAINSVYTPPEFRGRGYAGAITAVVARHIFSEGRAFACLYIDKSNPASNRCYAKLGFKPVCDAWHIVRSKLGLHK
ncbi:GNAT family N-acetyltransferase [Rhodomicrobium vannielii ATCC 17100]|uniref:GNAT family N-acetyltransferase n=1 Tax=Rhodomicrobium vannielii TaxID=1069 RepID=UPI00191A2495|nr:GNAT family N-acetyltransferase [Rhodomicrobium vannielii]MBJ7533413.1 GNAT family N-acetyltransferase [Rhodomicrobium vannielii ATCC 17100]